MPTPALPTKTAGSNGVTGSMQEAVKCSQVHA